MIISASRRTDIPAFYSEWFYHRLKEGYVEICNPRNPHQVSRILMNREVIDCIVFWTKNPENMLPRLSELHDFNYYFQFTLTPYNQQIETHVPNKERVIETFRKLSAQIGPHRVIWRYDPIMMTEEVDVDYHLRNFECMASRLKSHTHTCVISFLDMYKKTQRNIKNIHGRELTIQEIETLCRHFSEIAKNCGIEIQTCAEEVDLDLRGIKHGSCIDPVLIENLTGKKIQTTKDKNQRKACGCIQSTDIGQYNTCKHGCVYCYAT